jgi:tetratricopeptide repeat protein
VREGERLLGEEVERGILIHRARHCSLLGRACLLLDCVDEAEAFGERALASCRSQPGHAAHALLLLGDIATRQERLEPGTGEAHYRQALGLAEPRGMRPLVAHCHLGLGKLYRHTDKREQARQHLATATAMYREMGMTYWLEKAEDEMMELGV